MKAARVAQKTHDFIGQDHEVVFFGDVADGTKLVFVEDLADGVVRRLRRFVNCGAW